MSMPGGLVVGGAEVAQCGVPAAGVVEALEVAEDGVGQLLAGGPGMPVEQLGLQGGEEALGQAIVQAVADAAHRAEQAGLAQPLPERPAGVLRPVDALLCVKPRSAGFSSRWLLSVGRG